MHDSDPRDNNPTDDVDTCLYVRFIISMIIRTTSFFPLSLCVSRIEDEHKAEDGHHGDDYSTNGETKSNFTPEKGSIPVSGYNSFRPTGKYHCNEP